MATSPLTAEQREQLEAWHQAYLAIGASTQPADWAEAEDGIATLYRDAGLGTPRFVHTASPRAANLFIHVMEAAEHHRPAFMRLWDLAQAYAQRTGPAGTVLAAWGDSLADRCSTP